MHLTHCEQIHVTHLPFGLLKRSTFLELFIPRWVKWYIVFLLIEAFFGPINPCEYYLAACIIYFKFHISICMLVQTMQVFAEMVTYLSDLSYCQSPIPIFDHHFMLVHIRAILCSIVSHRYNSTYTKPLADKFLWFLHEVIRTSQSSSKCVAVEWG